MDARPDALVVPCSGGGLSAGCALAFSQQLPQTSIVTAEPAGFDDMARSLEHGEMVENEEASGSICDALLVKSPGALTLPMLRKARAKGVTIGDEEVLHAMRVALETFKIVVEPGGAAALAAVIAGRTPIAGRTVVVICSGGNVDRGMICRALGGRDCDETRPL